MIIDSFKRLDDKKQQRILNAAFIEFTENGYDRASTNVIAKEADIGKGTLFYYFENKESLFTYLIDYALKKMYEEYLSCIDYSETDFFKRIIQLSQLKRRAFSNYGTAFSFLVNVFLNLENYSFLSKDLIQEREKTEKIRDGMLKKNIDFSKVKDDIPSDKALKLINWSIEGQMEEMEEKFKHEDMTKLTEDVLQSYYDEFYEYLTILKKVYYKPEYVNVETDHFD